MSTLKSNQADKTNTAFQRLGILGGTFDPIHNGHINTAIETAKWLALDTIQLMPAHIPPHKTSTVATPLQRKKMVALACQSHPVLQLDSRELLRNHPSYTVDTLQEIHQENAHYQLFFIIGMDSFIQFTTWHRWQDILNLCHLVVNDRPRYEKGQMAQTLLQKNNYHCLSPYFADDLSSISTLKAGKILFHQQTPFDISSTEIRTALAQNTVENTMLPQAVLNYIQQQQLYKSHQ